MLSERFDGRPSLVVCTLLLCLLPVSVLGQSAQNGTDPDEPIPTRDEPVSIIEEELVVSASLVELPKNRVGSSVTVIDRDEIERRNKTTVAELLRSVPGLEVAQSGGPGKTTSVFIRGGNSSHTLVTLDGVRVNGNTTGAFDFSDLTADNLERIEIVRGPQGLLHGSEAVSGAINIVTRRGQGPARVQVRGALGSDDYSRFGLGVQGGDERFDYSFSASRLSTDGVSAADEDAGNGETDPWRNTTVSGRLGGAVLGDGRLDLALRYSDGDTSVDGFTFGVGPSDDLNAAQERQQFVGALTLVKPVTERWTQTLRVSGNRDELLGEDPDNVFSNFEIISENTEAMTRADLSLGSGDTLSVGYRYEERQADNVGSFAEDLVIRSVFAEGLWSWGERFDLSLGARNDDHSVFGDETTYRASLSVRAGGIGRFHASTGTGFKAPTFNDLYFPGFGNPDLSPETSSGYDAGFELSFDEENLVIDVTWFDTEFEDLIIFTFPAGFINVAEATSEGVELTLSWQPRESLHLHASHTYNETEDLATGLQLARRPENRSTLGASFDLGDKLRGSATLFVVDGRIDSDGADMDDYERLDLALDYRWNAWLRPFVRIENLLDSNYSEIPGFTTPGFTVAVGTHLDF